MKSLKKPLILLTEDEPIVRAIAATLLTESGYEVIEASDGIEACSILLTHRPDLILSDVRMPRCNGFEFLQRVRADQTLVEIPFIIFSAAGDRADHRMGMSLGADDYVVKPYQPAELLKAIEVRLARVAALGDQIRDHDQFLINILPREIRAPLVGVLGYAELITQAGEADRPLTREQLLEYGQGIRRAGWRLLETSKDFALRAELNQASGKSSPRADEWPIVEPISGAILHNHLRRYAGEFGRAQDLVLVIEDASVCVAQPGLPRVLQHLVSNALKFSLPGQTITVTGHRLEKHYEFCVTDHGSGMSSDQLRMLATTLHHDRAKSNKPGTGMGLALARTFAAVSHGHFDLRPNTPAPGLTATLLLPLEFRSVETTAGSLAAASPCAPSVAA